MKPSVSTTVHEFPKIPGYTIVEQIYAGSRTIVYRAVQVATQYPVIIKYLRLEYPSFGELVQFRNQYTIIRGIADANVKNLPIPGIVKPLSLEPLGKGYALIMEDCAGVSLDQYMQQQSLDLTEVLEIAHQLAEILHTLHQHRVVHKDIKPANILIQPASKQIKLIDFSIASLLPKETQEIKNPNVLEGTLAYLAPEQTGRMNRGIDYRSDFYSLGVTLYQLFTGKLPFVSDDPMELIHCHLAQQPAVMHSLNLDLPPILSEIVAKLMAKNAEDRYQSALGLRYDLGLCLSQWQEKGNRIWFTLGERDLCDRFLIPEKLYGRAAEVMELLSAFNRVSAGDSELLLVAGFSGIGKTAVVNEVHKPIVRQRGYFIKGKFDQFNRNIPLSAFVQALQDLMGQLLSESDADLENWQAKILAAVGKNGQVLIEVIPELEQVIGKQPPVPELSGSAAQNRFNLLFQKFIEVFTTPEHPLVVFLDDLQWADSASLQLIKLLMSDNGYLLMLGAYRDNEVSPIHPLILTVEEIRKANAIVNTITLTPLDLADTNHLVADTLNCSRELAQPLAELIDRKTQGNPFFTTQFLKALHDDGQITFDRDRRSWQCDIAQVKLLALTDDVVEFMALQLQKLPAATQQVLKLAACVGNQFDLSTLAIVLEQSPTEAATALWKALQEGLILPTSQIYKFFQGTEKSDTQSSVNPKYRFLHDRVQQAAYSLIPEDQQQSTHLAIARLLRQNTPDAELEANIFEIVNHWNRAIALLVDPLEKTNLAQLNLMAGNKAIAANAYELALTYCRTGIALLDDLGGWQNQVSLMLALHEGAAAAAYLCGDFAEMEQWVSAILAQKLEPLDLVKTYDIQIQAHSTQSQFPEAIAIGQNALEQFNIHLPKQPTPADIVPAMQEIAALLNGRTAHDLLDLPVMTNAVSLASMQLLSSITAASYVSAPLLFPFVILAQVKLSIQAGNTALSTFSYSCYAILLSGVLEDLDAAYEFGKLGLELVEKFKVRTVQTKVNFVVGAFTIHCKSHIQNSLPLLTEAFKIGLEVGDFERTGYSAANLCIFSYAVGKELTTLLSEVEIYIATLLKLNIVSGSNYCSIVFQTIQRLQAPRSEAVLTAQKEMHHTLTGSNDLTGLHWYWVYRLTASYLLNELVEAKQDAASARQTLAAGVGMISIPIFYFYDSLTALADFSEVTDKTAVLDRVSENQTKLHHRAHHAPMNFQHKYDLVEAERYRVLGEKREAIDLYDKAIAGAKANGYIQEEALANELAAKFYLNWGKEKIAQDYLTNAYYAYAHWGAKAKVQDLEQRYPELLAPILQQQRTALSATETIFATTALATVHTPGTQASSSGSTSISATLDLETVLKASQALSSEIQLDKLLATLLHTVLENAGADKAALLMPHDQQWFVEAVATIHQPAQVQSVALSDSLELPHSLIHSVKRSLQPVVIVDATAHPTLAGDTYVMQQQPKSMLCTPILNQGQLVAILYLENHSTVGAFTSDRIELLNFLSTQAAISLENARLYIQEQQKVIEISQKEAEYRSIFETVQDGLSICDLETGQIISVNPAFCQIYGYAPETLLNLTPVDFMHPDSLPLFSNFLETLNAGKEFYTQATGKHKEGHVFDVEVKAVPFIYKGKPHGLSIVRDISDRKAAEQTLREVNALLNSVIEAIPDIFFAKNCQGQHIALNPALANFFGKSTQEILGKTDAELLPPEVADPIMAKDRQIMSAGTIERFEETVPTHGVDCTYLTVKVPLRNTDGEIIGLLGIAKDISDRIAAEAAIQQKSRELEQALQHLQNAQLQMVQSEKMASLGNLVASVAHEINNPIGFLNGSINNAKEYVQDLLDYIVLYQQHHPNPAAPVQAKAEYIDLEFLSEDFPKLLSSMQGATDRIKSISTSLRTFSRTDTEYKVSANLHQGLDSALLILKYRLKANEYRPEIAVVREYGELPAINCFPGQLNQVFMNILANAIDMFDEMAQTQSFAELEAKPQQITIRTVMLGTQVEIGIQDNGKGMTKEVKARIFDHLFTTKAVGKGTGLGLAIAHQIVVGKHGGTIAVQSEQGQGSEFIIQLPIV